MQKIKPHLLLLVFLSTSTIRSQTFTPDVEKDSLSGFNEKEIILHAKQNNVEGTELRNYVEQRKRDFIRDKYFTVRRKEDENAN